MFEITWLVHKFLGRQKFINPIWTLFTSEVERGSPRSIWIDETLWSLLVISVALVISGITAGVLFSWLLTGCSCCDGICVPWLMPAGCISWDGIWVFSSLLSVCTPCGSSCICLPDICGDTVICAACSPGFPAILTSFSLFWAVALTYDGLFLVCPSRLNCTSGACGYWCGMFHAVVSANWCHGCDLFCRLFNGTGTRWYYRLLCWVVCCFHGVECLCTERMAFVRSRWFLLLDHCNVGGLIVFVDLCGDIEWPTWNVNQNQFPL